MDPELRRYLDERFDAVEKKISSDKLEILEVIKETNENTSGIIERFENYHADLVNRTSGLSNRIDFLQEQIEDIKKEINA